MTRSVTARSLLTRGCYSETGRLRKVVTCPPTNFHITQPINMIQLMWSYDGLVYRDVFDAVSLDRIQAVYPSLISLTKEEQKNGAANVPPFDPRTIITIAENAPVERDG